jgi:predicted ArsR family transcriptional regulator
MLALFTNRIPSKKSPFKKAITFFIIGRSQPWTSMRTDGAIRVLYVLKSRGPAATRELARRLGITETGVRQHMAALHDKGLVSFDERPEGVGRPRRLWRLTEAGHGRFPDRHGDLLAGLLEDIRGTFGLEGLDRLIRARERQTLAAYRRALEPLEELGERVRALAKLRTAEGYMADAQRQRDGSWLLIENHCPICVAAKACQGFCRSELDVFAAAFGNGVVVRREEHLLTGARRCVYRIAEKLPRASRGGGGRGGAGAGGARPDGVRA